MTGGPVRLRALLTHARRVPAAERARFALELRDALAGRGIVIESCHRVEGYACSPEGLEALAQLGLPDRGLDIADDVVVRHVIAVATGRDSVVVGEDQILHQVRTSVDDARRHGGLDPVLERLLAVALHAGRRARSWRQSSNDSLATVALSEVARRTGPLEGRGVLVVGAGRMGRLAARSARTMEAAVAVANRTAERAVEVAHEVGGRTVPLDPGTDVSAFAAIILALGAPWQIDTRTREALVASATTVVDLSVPSALDDRLARRIAPRLVTADDLARLDAPVGRSDSREMRRLDALIDRTTAEFLTWLDGRLARAAAAALASRVDAARAAELDALWRQLPDLDPETRALIDEMTRHLAARLFREPLERLGNDPDGQTERAVREVFAL